ncbi:MAG: hypothetical protein R3C05_05950 [Pirellulaceae bacterium]
MSNLTDVQWIFIVLAILYIFESHVWVRTGTIPFVRTQKMFRNPMGLRGSIGNESGKLQPAGWLPADTLIPVQPIPLTISERGICGVTLSMPLLRQRGVQSGIVLTWDEANELKQDGHRLMFKNRTLCAVQSPQLARLLKSKLLKIASLDTDQRGEAIEAFKDEAFDAEAVADRVELWRRSTRRLCIASSMLFVWLFPVGLAKYADLLPIVQDWRSLIGYLVIGLIFWWWSVLEIYLAHRKLYRDQRASRWKMFFTGLISPVVPLRMRSTLARDLLTFVHPVTFVIATARLRQQRCRATDDCEPAFTEAETIMIGQCLRDATHPGIPVLPDGCSEDALLFAQEDHRGTLERVQNLVDSAGLDRQHLLHYQAEDSHSRSYCPRCLTEFTINEAICVECGGIATEPFEKREGMLPI